MVEKLQEERESAASEAESAKRRTKGEMERSLDLVETEKLGLERSVILYSI